MLHWHHLRRDKLRLHQLDLLSLLLEVDEVLWLLVTAVTAVLSSVETAPEVVVFFSLVALHHVTRFEFELAAEDHGEAVGAAGLLDTGNASAHAPLVHFMSECVSFVLEKAELLRSENSMSARGIDMSNT